MTTPGSPPPGGEPHHIAWTIEPERISGKMTCHGGPGADCRMACPNECEGACSHTLVDSGECQTLPWLEEAELTETYAGDETRLRDGWLHTWWNGDYVSWVYADDRRGP